MSDHSEPQGVEKLENLKVIAMLALSSVLGAYAALRFFPYLLPVGGGLCGISAAMAYAMVD